MQLSKTQKIYAIIRRGNMKDNHFEKWIPHKDVDAVYDMEDVGYDTGEGFVVVLRCCVWILI